jgi:hypothetical protein
VDRSLRVLKPLLSRTHSLFRTEYAGQVVELPLFPCPRATDRIGNHRHADAAAVLYRAAL